MSAKPPPASLARAAISPSASRRDLMAIVWSLAWPAIMTFGLESSVGLVDALMVGRLGATAVAGVGVGTQILNAVSVMNMALATISAVVRMSARDAPTDGGATTPVEASTMAVQSTRLWVREKRRHRMAASRGVQEHRHVFASD